MEVKDKSTIVKMFPHFFVVFDQLSLALLLSQLYWQPVSLILSCPDLFFTTLKCNVPLF